MNFDFFKNKKANTEKLLKFGFINKNGEYFYCQNIINGEFLLRVILSVEGKIRTEVIETDTKEIYTLHLVEGVNGSFVGKIKDEYENTLRKIAEECFEIDVFKSDFSKKVITYARKKYGDELEYLWEKFSKNAILRRKDTEKWYAALLTVSKNKIGLNGEEVVEILDLRANPDEVDSIVDNKKYFPGYHMNKKHWITIILDGSVPEKELYKKIDISYSLAVKK